MSLERVGELFKINNHNQIFISFYHPNSRQLSSKILFEKLLITYQEAKGLRQWKQVTPNQLLNAV